MNARGTTLSMLASRQPGRTICPSDVAKALTANEEPGGTDWRDKMAEVHAAVDRLVDEGLIRLSWKGEMLSKRAGPYRIRRSE